MYSKIHLDRLSRFGVLRSIHFNTTLHTEAVICSRFDCYIYLMKQLLTHHEISDKCVSCDNAAAQTLRTRQNRVDGIHTERGVGFEWSTKSLCGSEGVKVRSQCQAHLLSSQKFPVPVAIPATDIPCFTLPKPR